jgi:hypothetical protein
MTLTSSGRLVRSRMALRTACANHVPAWALGCVGLRSPRRSGSAYSRLGYPLTSTPISWSPLCAITSIPRPGKAPGRERCAQPTVPPTGVAIGLGARRDAGSPCTTIGQCSSLDRHRASDRSGPPLPGCGAMAAPAGLRGGGVRVCAQASGAWLSTSPSACGCCAEHAGIGEVAQGHGQTLQQAGEVEAFLRAQFAD